MHHLSTQRKSEEWEVIYHLSPAEKGDGTREFFTYRFHRIVLGATFAEGVCFATVVGERVFWAEDERDSARFYVVIDEVEAATSFELFQQLISLKDRYAAGMVYVPKEPKDLIDSLKRLEGLTHYPKATSPAACRVRWSTFEGYRTAGVYELAPPSTAIIQRDLGHLMSTPVRSPDDSTVLIDTRLVLPHELPTERCRTAVRQEHAPVCQALWCAAMGLENSHPRKKLPWSPFGKKKRSPNPITGY